MNYKHFIGIDVSKSWLDFTVLDGPTLLFHQRTSNSLEGIKDFYKALRKQKTYHKGSALFCMEHTGIYNNHLLQFLSNNKLQVCLESGIQIKQSSGLKRGKNDKVDSLRIATYAFKNQHELRLWKPKREIVVHLKHLTTLRARLVNVLRQLRTPIKEALEFTDKGGAKLSIQMCKSSIKSLEGDLKKLDQEIKSVIQADPELHRLFNLATSVTGIGAITAIEMIITTNEFKSINCPKKFACYSAVAPFEHQSGSSIRGKTRVSSMGNKATKKLLHMAALSASNCSGDLKNYYERKVAEGKNKMLVLNALRNKLIARVFACVKNNRVYQKDFAPVLV